MWLYGIDIDNLLNDNFLDDFDWYFLENEDLHRHVYNSIDIDYSINRNLDDLFDLHFDNPFNYLFLGFGLGCWYLNYLLLFNDPFNWYFYNPFDFDDPLYHLFGDDFHNAFQEFQYNGGDFNNLLDFPIHVDNLWLDNFDSFAWELHYSINIHCLLNRYFYHLLHLDDAIDVDGLDLRSCVFLMSWLHGLADVRSINVHYLFHLHDLLDRHFYNLLNVYNRLVGNLHNLINVDDLDLGFSVYLNYLLDFFLHFNDLFNVHNLWFSNLSLGRNFHNSVDIHNGLYWNFHNLLDYLSLGWAGNLSDLFNSDFNRHLHKLLPKYFHDS